jgi:LysR family glycine cleavage system transcriptional activator
VILAVAAATEGHGLALVSEAVIWPHLRDGRLIQPFATSMPATQAYYLVCQESRATDPALAQLTGWLVRHVQDKKATLLAR